MKEVLFGILSLLSSAEANQGVLNSGVSSWTLVAGLVVLVLVALIVKSILTAPKGNLPPLIGGIPYLGCGYKFFLDPAGLMFEGWKKFGSVFSLYICGERMTLLCDAEGFELFFKAGVETFSASEAYKFTIPVFGRGVVYDAPPDLLVEQKRMLKTSMTSQRFEAYVRTIVEECERFFDQEWKNGGTFDLLTAFNELTVNTSTHCLQGIEVREKFTAEFSKLYSDLDAALSPIGFFFPNAPLPAMLRRDSARQKLGQLFDKIIERRKQNPTEHHEDFLATLMDSHYKDGSLVSNEEIVGLLVGLLLAGQHTSNVTATWMGIMLLCHPQEMKKAIEEQERVLNGKSQLTYEDLKQMDHLEHVMKETLRLRPPIIMLMRRVLQDVEFKGYKIPKGSLVSVSPLLSHRIPDYWTEPQKFDPERHTRDDQTYRWAYMAFGGGRHKCSGETFAYLQVKTIWSVILRKYNLELVNGMPEPDYTTLIAGPKPPVMVRVTKKN